MSARVNITLMCVCVTGRNAGRLRTYRLTSGRFPALRKRFHNGQTFYNKPGYLLEYNPRKLSGTPLKPDGGSYTSPRSGKISTRVDGTRAKRKTVRGTHNRVSESKAISGRGWNGLFGSHAPVTCTCTKRIQRTWRTLERSHARRLLNAQLHMWPHLRLQQHEWLLYAISSKMTN